MEPPGKPGAPATRPFQHALHEIIFEAETFGGKAFDISLLVLILFSIIIVSLETVTEFDTLYGKWLTGSEWVITIIFTIEYLLRIYCVGKPIRYILSFYGLVDLLAVLPTYLSLFITGTQYLLVIRTLRLLRVFRIFKLTRYIRESTTLMSALRASREKITVFLFGVLSSVVIIGSIMYLVEGPERGFSNIPVSIYWAIVTLTTVGYGDIAPQTPLGQIIASMVMIMGYGIIAVPTGIVTVELAQATRKSVSTMACPVCGREGHSTEATYCQFCGEKL